MVVGVSLLVVLLMCWGVHWTHGQDPLTVSITVSRTDPPGFTPENPNEYRAASGPVVVTCTATGGSGSGDYGYVWTSTCSGCKFQGTTTGVTSVISRTAVHSGDIGTHTCTASRGGDSASDSIVFNVVGAGFHVFNGASTSSQPNNGLAILTDVGSGYRIRFFCRSDSLTRNVGELIGLDGNTFSGNDYLAFQPPVNGGELRIDNTVGSEEPLPASEQGIYTCRIPLQSGEMVTINIGVYPIGFNSGPTNNDPLLFTPGSPSTVTCISTDSPATTVTFMRGSTTVGPFRDGESVVVGGVTYELAQRVINRRESTYENVLTINDALANLVDDTFTCTVANILGMDTSPSITISGAETSISLQTVNVGDTVTFTCTSLLGPAMIQWEDRDNGDMVLRMTPGMQTELALELGPVSQSMDGSMYRCRVVFDGSTILETVTLTIEAPSVTADIGVSSPTVVGGSVTLTCDVTGLNSLASGTTITFSGPRTVTGTGSTSLQLLLDPALLSDAGQYTCMATVTSSLLDSAVGDTDTEDLRLQIPNPSVSVSGIGGTTLYAGIVLTLTCEIAVNGIPADMLSNIDVSTTWTEAGGNELTSGGRITVTPAELESGTTYISTVEFHTLGTNHNGMYTCQANINPSVSLMFIDASSSADVLTLDSQFPTLELSAVSSTTRLPDVTPYNTFTLTCTATAPEGVVAPKIFIWRRADSADDTCDDFSVVGGNMGSNLEQPVSTSALNVTVSNADIGTLRYCCQVSITDLGGIDVSGNSMTSITVVGPAPPMQPTNVRIITTNATTATVQWTVPLIAYTPETYRVSYSTDGNCQVLMSCPVESGVDFDAMNQMFSVELTGLEPNTTYNYQVISESTVSTTTSELQNLTTTSDPGAGTSSDASCNIAVIGGVLGGLVALLLAYSVVTTIVIVVLMHRNRCGKVSIDQPVYDGVEQPVMWSRSATTGYEDLDIKTRECVAYNQALPPSTNEDQDATYDVIDEN